VDKDTDGLAMRGSTVAITPQDERLLREYWYMFVQQRLELEEQMLQVPLGICSVYEIDPLAIDTTQDVRYAIAYIGETTQFYHLCKNKADWKQLFADWLFHRGKRPDVVQCDNHVYEDICRNLHTDNFGSLLTNNTIYATGLYTTMQALKSGIRLIETEGTALSHRQGLQKALQIFDHSQWKTSFASLDKLTTQIESQKTPKTIRKDSVELTLHYEHLARVCLYKFGQLQAIRAVVHIYKDLPFSQSVAEHVRDAKQKLTSYCSVRSHDFKNVGFLSAKNTHHEEEIEEQLRQVKDKKTENNKLALNVQLQVQQILNALSEEVHREKTGCNFYSEATKKTLEIKNASEGVLNCLIRLQNSGESQTTATNSNVEEKSEGEGDDRLQQEWEAEVNSWWKIVRALQANLLI